MDTLVASVDFMEILAFFYSFEYQPFDGYKSDLFRAFRAETVIN